ncbi:DUF4326 domain-containing protein [Halobaculum sp. MBLA0147]|uniref:DUF4326 domain-containing protein n=1 Tax=Halobaculum sp. MBLA0147 TaxID=3079934 RepID=UPI003524D8C9
MTVDDHFATIVDVLAAQEQADVHEYASTRLVSLRSHSGEGVTKIDRSTQFGNPFTMETDGGAYTREGCVKAYAANFAHRLQVDEIFRGAVDQLAEETLACWCVPKLCHGHVVLAYLAGDLDVEWWADVDPERFAE